MRSISLSDLLYSFTEYLSKILHLQFFKCIYCRAVNAFKSYINALVFENILGQSKRLYVKTAGIVRRNVRRIERERISDIGIDRDPVSCQFRMRRHLQPVRQLQMRKLFQPFRGRKPAELPRAVQTQLLCIFNFSLFFYFIILLYFFYIN